MKLQAKAGAQSAYLDGSDSGEGLAIFFSQDQGATVRWRLDVSATLDDGSERLVGTVYVSPPNATAPIGALTRQVAAAVCPGAKSWAVNCYPASGPVIAPEECASIELASSKCCTAPVGLTRVSERYGYKAAVTAGATNYTFLPGQTITRIVANNGSGVLGTLTVAGSNTISVPNGMGLTLEPRAPIPQLANVLNIANLDWVAEYTESA